MKQKFTFLGLLCLLFTFNGVAQDKQSQFDEATGRWGMPMNDNFTALVMHPTDAFLGIESNSISKPKADKLGFTNPYGAYISKVVSNTAAHKAGLLPFDYLYGIGEYRTTRQSAIGDLLAEYEPKDWVDLHLIRNGRKLTIQAQLDHEPEVEDLREESQAFLGISRIGQFRNDMSGVPVNILPNSTAKSIGMQNGDKITHINNHMILDWDDISTAIGSLKPQQEISVTFERNNQKTTRTGAIKSYSETSNEPFLFSDNKIEDENLAEHPNSNHHPSRTTP